MLGNLEIKNIEKDLEFLSKLEEHLDDKENIKTLPAIFNKI